jgi:hypothetical protein
MDNTVQAGSLEEFVSLLCSNPPQAPCSQVMDIENARDPEEMQDICTQIYLHMYAKLHGDLALLNRYFLSLGFRVFQTTSDDPQLASPCVVVSRIRRRDNQIIAFEYLNVGANPLAE